MPKIDAREFQALLDEKKAMIPLYTPEWDLSDEKDVGSALLKIFTHMQLEIINSCLLYTSPSPRDRS